MSSVVEDIERSILILVCQDQLALLEAINRGLIFRIFINKDHRELYSLIVKYYNDYRCIPTAESLVAYTQTTDGITEHQKTKSILFYQEILVADKPDLDINTGIDSLFNNYKRREAKEIALHLVDTKNVENINNTLDNLVSSFTKLKNIGNKEEDIAEYSNAAADRLAKYEAARTRGGSGGLMYCFPTLNKITGGQDPGTLWIIRGGPKAGKSTALINMANHVVSTGKNILYFSAEVSREVIERRLDASNVHIPINGIKLGTLTDAQHEKYVKYLQTKDPKRGEFITIDNGAMNPEYIKAQTLSVMGKKEVHLVVVDYLSLLHTTQKVESNWLEIGEITKGLRAMAKELQIPVLTAVQVNIRSGKTALSQEIENTTDLLLDISRENPDEDAIAGAAVQLQAKIILSRDSGLGQWEMDANFAFGEMYEVTQDSYLSGVGNMYE